MGALCALSPDPTRAPRGRRPWFRRASRRVFAGGLLLLLSPPLRLPSLLGPLTTTTTRPQQQPRTLTRIPSPLALFLLPPPNPAQQAFLRALNQGASVFPPPFPPSSSRGVRTGWRRRESVCLSRTLAPKKQKPTTTPSQPNQLLSACSETRPTQKKQPLC